MASIPTPPKSSPHLERMIFLPVLGVLVAIWGIVVAFTAVERDQTIERATTQLAITASALADFNELSEKAGSPDATISNRTAAVWRVLLQYPTANIWIENKGGIATGEPPDGAQGPYIFVQEARANAIVHIALPEADVLADWRYTTQWRSGIVAAVSLAFLLMTYFLLRALRQRSAVERKALLAQERAAQLVLYQGQLEETVARRTSELTVAKGRVEVELVERTAAEQALREHDALLNAVTRSASELLGANSYGDAIAVVLELIALTVTVGRVQLNAFTSDSDGHMRSTVAYEWCAPGASATLDNPAFHDMDVRTHFPETVALIVSGEAASFLLRDIPEQYRPIFEKQQMQSFLQIPIMIGHKLWGNMTFVDSFRTERKWSWAETDGLKTLGGLIGVAIARARFVKELADANVIVQNSPTILYRLRAEPSFPLIYISQNIVKFGHDPAQLLASPNWVEVLIHPDDREKVGAAMMQLIEKDSQGATIEFRIRKGDGGLRWVEDRYIPVRDKLGRLMEIEGIIIDVTERKMAEEKTALLARTDILTGLANRVTFIERLHQMFAGARRGAGSFAVLYLDLDHFKDVNDTLGHPLGDRLLIQAAERLTACARENDLVARLGGDEFAVLQADTGSPADAGELANRIVHSLGLPYMLDNNEVRISASIGICPYAASSAGPDNMLSQADLALYRAKDQGRNQYRFHTEDLDKEVFERVTLSDELRRGIERGELELYYQPQVEVISGKIAGVEALVRWHHPTRGLLLPGEFLPIAEQTGTIMALGHWVLDQACRQTKLWRNENTPFGVITINLALSQLKNSREIVRDVVTTVKDWGLVPSDFEFDVTEATIAHLTWTQNDALTQLHRLGCRVAIANFGTEYSSFEYLRSYNVNHLKIARSLVASAVADPERAVVIRVMVNMARELGIGIMAEGIETEEQRAMFINNGTPTMAQGFYFGEAVNASRTGELLRHGYIKPLPAGGKAGPSALALTKDIQTAA